MSDTKSEELRAERVARYKEERRRQLATQFSALSEPSPSARRPSDPLIRATRTSALRAAANQNASNEHLSNISSSSYKQKSNFTSTKGPPEDYNNRDKSSKRKSNLNRSLASEAVPAPENGRDIIRRRRRQETSISTVIKTDTSEQKSHQVPTTRNEISKPSRNTNSTITESSTDPYLLQTTPQHQQPQQNNKILENQNTPTAPQIVNDGAVTRTFRFGEKENVIQQVSQGTADRQRKCKSKTDTIQKNTHNTNISKRMDELTALTNETLARVERLTQKNTKMISTPKNPSSTSVKTKRNLGQTSSSSASPIRNVPIVSQDKQTVPPPPPPVHCASPVSILKRKSSKDETNASVVMRTSTQPVTFSPNVIEPKTYQRKRGILKKRASLDETQVLRHRSCSPDVNKSDSRQRALRQQRRSSLEEHIKLSDFDIPGILKTKSSTDDVSVACGSTNELQGILKRKCEINAASNQSTILNLCSVINTEVIETTNDQVGAEHWKPILKKKSFSEESTSGKEVQMSDTPKPILKKKSSTETDDSEDKPKRPILKTPRVCSWDSKDDDSEPSAKLKTTLRHCSRESSTELEPKSILKGSNSRNASPSSKGRKFSGDVMRNLTDAVHSDEATGGAFETVEKCVKRLSVSEMVGNMEKGFVPEAAAASGPSTETEVSDASSSLSKRKSSGRYQTQPITFSEIEQSLNLFLPMGPQLVQQLGSAQTTTTTNGEDTVTSSNENNQQLDAFSAKGKEMSSGDDNARCLEMDSSLVPDVDSQPVVSNNATKEDDDDEQDPSKLSLSDRVKLFNQCIIKPKPVTNRRKARFQTQPVTSKEVETAQRISPPRSNPINDNERSTDLGDNEKRGILKCPTPELKSSQVISAAAVSDSDSPRSVLKKHRSPPSTKFTDNLKSILKQDSGDNIDVVVTTRSVHYEKSSIQDVSTDSSSVFETDVVSSEDGDSSGAQEIQRIMNKDKDRTLIRQIQKQHSRLSKSKSHGAVEESKMSQSIAERRAALEHFGDTEWRKRQMKFNSANEELNNLASEQFNMATPERSKTVSSILAARKEELETSALKWKKRIETSDANSFSVAGRMKHEFHAETETSSLKILSAAENIKRLPIAKAFKGTKIEKSATTSSLSDYTETKHITSSFLTRRIEVHRPDDETFTSFFSSSNNNNNVNFTSSIETMLQFSKDDLDSVQRVSDNLFTPKRVVKIQRNHATSRNPVKALAARTDLLSEYNEVITGVAAKEVLRMNIEKMDNKFNMAMEALAGLTSKEDFSAVALKKTTLPTSTYLHYKEMLLLHVKGRRHIQTRLIEPIANSINDGDNFILITPSAIYNYVGKYSNVIEQSKASDIASYIHLMNDMSCKTSKILTVGSGTIIGSRDLETFWKLLGAPSGYACAPAGHPDEDEIYETAIIETNKIYQLRDNELVPVDEYWGAMPKYEMLKSSEIFVYDFGSELFVWNGKNAIKDDKKTAYNLAKQMWTEGYNYTECQICPLNISVKVGERAQNPDTNMEEKASKTRPEWALFTKITQHMEPIIFKEKFLDWPDFSRNKDKNTDAIKDKSWDGVSSIEPCDVEVMRLKNTTQPDLYLDGSHLGRGTEHYDEESNRLFKTTTLDITVWHILEYSHEKLGDKSIGQFFNGDSYVIRWKYQLNVMGRELSGKPSKYGMRGRDRSAYFCWQGKNALVSEKGAAALLTVELDSENARQINISQGAEPPAFLNLWNGLMTIHDGRRDQLEKYDYIRPRLFLCKGTQKNETVLIEVPCNTSSLRSRTSFALLVNPTNNAANTNFILWHGSKATKQTRQYSKIAVEKIIKVKPPEYGFDNEKNVDLDEVEEGFEGEEFINNIDGSFKDGYFKLTDVEDVDFNFTPRLFHFSSTLGAFQADEILCPYRSDETTPYPFLQSDLYSVSQPALFLFDNGYEIWLWQGWWPTQDNEEQAIGSITRWQYERRATMQTALNYWQGKETENIPAYLIFAGLEPLAFTNLFPTWEKLESATTINTKEGKKDGEILLLESELARLSRSTYPLEEILHRPLPEGVDPSRLEDYLSKDDFQKLLSMTKTEFQKLPTWRQTAIKKEKGLF